MFSEKNCLDLMDRLVRFHTTADRIDELKACADFVADFFVDTAFSVDRFLYNNIPSLFISRQTKHPTVLLYAHFDVVPGDDTQFVMHRDGDLLYGRGVFDMKGPMALFMLLMKEIEKTEHDVGLILVGDEETGSKNGCAELTREGYGGDVVIMPDGGMKIDNIITKEKGIIQFYLKAHGKAVHSSVAWKGESAITKLIKAIQAIEPLFVPFDNHPEDHWTHTFTVGKIAGGVMFNQVPAFATANCDVRLTEVDTPQELLEKIRARLPEGVEIEESINVPINTLFEETPLTLAFVDTIREHGRSPQFSVAHGASDARYFVSRGGACIVCQPDGADHHGANEFVSLVALEAYYKIVRDYIEKVAV